MGSHALGSSGAAFSPQSRSGRIFPPFLWRRLPVLNVAARDVDHELGELGGIAGAVFQGFVGHCASMRDMTADFQRTALCLIQRSPLPAGDYIAAMCKRQQRREARGIARLEKKYGGTEGLTKAMEQARAEMEAERAKRRFKA